MCVGFFFFFSLPSRIVGIQTNLKLNRTWPHRLKNNYLLDSEDDFRSSCRNVSHQQQFFSVNEPQNHETKRVMRYNIYSLKCEYNDNLQSKYQTSIPHNVTLWQYWYLSSLQVRYRKVSPRREFDSRRGLRIFLCPMLVSCRTSYLYYFICVALRRQWI